jgi:hypothetical protein
MPGCRSARPVSGEPAQDPGVVRVRLSGERGDIDRLVALWPCTAEVIQRSGPRPNRREPGVRVYLTVRVAGGGG